MYAALIFIAAMAAIVLMSENAAADAPGHCCSATEKGSYGMKFSFDELVQLAQNAGSDWDVNVAAAIALAESGGDPNAYNPETQAGTPEGEGSYGLWQVYLHKHPEFATMDKFDPQTNANEAYLVYTQAGGFSPWSTFKSGKYQEFLA
jgi:hypothetical protein